MCKPYAVKIARTIPRKEEGGNIRLLFDNYFATSERKWPIVYTIEEEVTVLHAGKNEQKGSPRKNNRANDISRRFWSRYASCLESHRDSVHPYT